MSRLAVAALALSFVGCHEPAPVLEPPAPPEPAVEDALGIPMPPGTRVIGEDSGAGPEGATASMTALATEVSPAECIAHFASLPGSTATRPGCVSVEGAEVCVTSREEIPHTLFAPVRPVVDEAPSWSRAWIRIGRTSSPPPCPPCQPGGTPPPGCRCPD